MGTVKKARRYLLFGEKVHLAQRVNGFLYFLKRIPWLGRKISPDVYRAYRFKGALFVLVAIVSVLISMVTKGFFVVGSALLVSVGEWVVEHIFSFDVALTWQEFVWGGLFVWLLLSLLMGIYQIWFAQIEPGTLELMDQFHLPKKSFVRSMMMKDVGLNAVYYVPTAVAVSWLLDSFILAVGMPILYVALGCLSHYLARLVRSKHPFSLMKHGLMLLIGAVGFLAAGMLLPLIVGIRWIETVIFSPISVVVSLVVAFIACRGILTFKNESHFLAIVINRSTAIYEAAEQLTQNTTQKVQQKLVVTDLHGQFDGQKGSAYLNALLFERYKREFRKMVLTRLLISAIVIVMFGALTIFWTDLFIDPSELIPVLHLLGMPIWISMFSVGRKMVQTIFINCDNAMLYYPFYRTKEVIVASFYDRLKRTFVLNSVLGITPLAVVAIILMANQTFDLVAVVTSLLILTSLLALFSFHELFLYYMLQPFAEGMEVKSPLYTVITGISSAVSWLIVGMDLPNTWLISDTLVGLLLAVVTLIYMGIGFVVLGKLAPKTFRAKG